MKNIKVECRTLADIAWKGKHLEREVSRDKFLAKIPIK